MNVKYIFDKNNRINNARGYENISKKEILLVETGDKIKIELIENIYSGQTYCKAFDLKVWLKEIPILYFHSHREYCGNYNDLDIYDLKDCGSRWYHEKPSKLNIVEEPFFSEDESVNDEEFYCENGCINCGKRGEAKLYEKNDRQYYNKKFLKGYIIDNNLNVTLDKFISFLIYLTSYFTKVTTTRESMKLLPTKFGEKWKKKRYGYDKVFN